MSSIIISPSKEAFRIHGQMCRILVRSEVSFCNMKKDRGGGIIKKVERDLQCMRNKEQSYSAGGEQESQSPRV